MNSSIDPYETLSKCGVHLPAHIIYLLKELGYNSLIAISRYFQNWPLEYQEYWDDYHQSFGEWVET